MVDDNNEISDYVLYSLGLLDDRELIALMQNAFMQQSQQTDTVEQTRFSFEDILKVTYKLILSADYYEKQEGVWMDRSDDPAYIAGLLQDAVELKIVGVLRPTENAVATSIGGAIGYTKELTEFVVGETQKRQIVQEQLADMQHNVLTGEEFSMNNVVNTYDMVALKLGIVDLDHPSSVSIYPKSFDTKDSIVDVIEAYNNRVKADGEEDKVLNYTDMVGTLMSSVTTIVNVISYVLIAFVSISLVVSSIMIGIITYISVLERTKEIGILRSIGASKRDISRVFNA